MSTTTAATAESPFGGLAFVDTETITLTPGPDVIWEIAVIARYDATLKPGCVDVPFRWQIRPNPAAADPKSLEISGFADRFMVPDGVDALYWAPGATEPKPIQERRSVARTLLGLLAGRHIVGAVPNFDTERLSLFLRDQLDIGRDPWHYHLIDVESLAAGQLRRPPPWSSDDLSRAVGVEPPSEEDRHTALGDARWARDLYDRVLSTSDSAR